MKVNVGSRKKRGQKKEERARALLPKKVAAALLDCGKGIPIKERNPGRAASLKHLQFEYFAFHRPACLFAEK